VGIISSVKPSSEFRQDAILSNRKFKRMIVRVMFGDPSIPPSKICQMKCIFSLTQYPNGSTELWCLTSKIVQKYISFNKIILFAFSTKRFETISLFDDALRNATFMLSSTDSRSLDYTSVMVVGRHLTGYNSTTGRSVRKRFPRLDTFQVVPREHIFSPPSRPPLAEGETGCEGKARWTKWKWFNAR